MCLCFTEFLIFFCITEIPTIYSVLLLVSRVVMCITNLTSSFKLAQIRPKVVEFSLVLSVIRLISRSFLIVSSRSSFFKLFSSDLKTCIPRSSNSISTICVSPTHSMSGLSFCLIAGHPPEEFLHLIIMASVRAHSYDHSSLLSPGWLVLVSTIPRASGWPPGGAAFMDHSSLRTSDDLPARIH